jgi:hypothetical protein
MPVLVKDGKFHTLDGKEFTPPAGTTTASAQKLSDEHQRAIDEHKKASETTPPEKSKSEEELTDESLHGKTPEIRQSAKETLDAMQKRKVEAAKATKDTPAKSEEEKAVEETAQSLAKGDLTNIRDVTGMMSGQRLRVYARAKEINPNFSTSDLQRQINMENFVTTGKMGDNIQAFGTFLEHAGNLSDVVQNIRLSGSPAVNKPLNWWREHMSGTHEYQELLTALEPVKKEYESFLLGNRAMYGDDRKAVDIILSDNASPAQYQGALKQMGKTAKDRYTEVNHRYKRVRKKDIEDPFTEDAKMGARKIGVDVGGADGGQGGVDPDVKAYADAHFGGDVEKAKAAISAQQGKK